MLELNSIRGHPADVHCRIAWCEGKSTPTLVSECWVIRESRYTLRFFLSLIPGDTKRRPVWLEPGQAVTTQAQHSQLRNSGSSTPHQFIPASAWTFQGQECTTSGVTWSIWELVSAPRISGAACWLLHHCNQEVDTQPQVLDLNRDAVTVLCHGSLSHLWYLSCVVITYSNVYLHYLRKLRRRKYAILLPLSPAPSTDPTHLRCCREHICRMNHKRYFAKIYLFDLR